MSLSEAHIMMRREQQARSLTLEPLADGAISSGKLPVLKEVVQAEHHDRIGIRQDPFVDRQLVAYLIDALEHRDRMAGDFASDLLEAERERWNSSNVPAIPCRKFAASHSGVS